MRWRVLALLVVLLPAAGLLLVLLGGEGTTRRATRPKVDGTGAHVEKPEAETATEPVPPVARDGPALDAAWHGPVVVEGSAFDVDGNPARDVVVRCMPDGFRVTCEAEFVAHRGWTDGSGRFLISYPSTTVAGIVVRPGCVRFGPLPVGTVSILRIRSGGGAGSDTRIGPIEIRKGLNRHEAR